MGMIMGGQPKAIETLRDGKHVMLQLRVTDAEPIVRQYAREAAYAGALMDYATRNVQDVPGRRYRDDFSEWRAGISKRYLAARRIVQAFGAEAEQISEQEALTIGHLFMKAGAKHPTENRKVGETEGVIDPKRPYPRWRGEVASEACNHAADRTVRQWRQTVGA